MPRIKEYDRQVGTPQVNLQAPVAENTGIVGKSVAQLGEAVNDLSISVHKNNIEDDVTNAHHSLSQLRNAYSDRILQETQNGSVDAQKIRDDYESQVNGIVDSMKTTEGKDYLQKHSDELGSDLIRSAAVSQAQLSGKMAVQKWKDSMDLNANTLEKTPADFEHVLTQSLSVIDEQVKAGTIPAAAAVELKAQTTAAYAESSIRGWAQINADTAANIMKQGVYDKYLTATQMRQMETEVKTFKRGEEVDSLRQVRLQEEAQKKVSDAWQQSNVAALYDNTITPKQILSSPMLPNKKIEWMNMLNSHLKQNLQTDPQLKADIYRRINLPSDNPQSIKSVSDLTPLVGKGITVTDLKQFSSFIDMTPEGERNKSNRALLLDNAKAQILQKGIWGGQTVGYENLSKYMNALYDKEAQMKKDDKDPSELYNPNSKDYFGNQIRKFKPTAEDYTALPTTSPITLDDNNKELGDTKRKPGETIEQWMTRTGSSPFGKGN